MHQDRLLHAELTDRILRAYYHVYNALGFGFLEKVYEGALFRTLQKNGLAVLRQTPINVWFEDEIVGEYFADLIVENLIIIELKVAKSLGEDHESQLVNYLKSTQLEVGLLLNFGPKPEFKRRVFANCRKPSFKQD